MIATSASSAASNRGRVAARAWLPTARSIDWRNPSAAGALAVALVVVQRLTKPGDPASSFTVKALVIAALVAVAVAAILPDAADALVDTSPTARVWRTVVRLSLVVLAWGAIWGLTLALIGTAPGSTPTYELTRSALVLLAVAVGAAAVRGPGAAAGAVALVALAWTVLPERWTINGSGPDVSWRLAAVAAAGLAALWWASRDHARRHRTLRLVRPDRRTMRWTPLAGP